MVVAVVVAALVVWALWMSSRDRRREAAVRAVAQRKGLRLVRLKGGNAVIQKFQVAGPAGIVSGGRKLKIGEVEALVEAYVPPADV